MSATAVRPPLAQPLQLAADYRALLELDEDSAVHEFRVLTGLTFHWGGR